MQFFKYMKDIYLDTYDQFVWKIEKSREEFLKYDNELIKMASNHLDMETASCLPAGRFNTNIEGIEFECFFHLGERNYLYVFLNGARKNTKESQSFFRWSYYKFLNGSMLNIVDPMLKLYPELRLGWYYGSADINLREKIAKLVEKVARMYKIEKNNIIFFGSSGGGTATFECANYIDGSKAVAINPQIILSEHGYSKEFTEITGIRLDKDTLWNRHNTILQMKDSQKIKYILIFNLRSEADMKQLQNICDEKKIKVKYGLNIFEELIIWIYDADAGKYKIAHNAQEYYCIWFFIEFLIINADNKDYLRDNESLFCLANEIWHNYYVQYRTSRDNIYGLRKALGRVNQKGKVAIWGTGNKATEILYQFLDNGGENDFNIRLAIDNQLTKRGTEFQGLPVLHPKDINDWKDMYIIITSELYDKDIKIQLESYGLEEGKDFISYKDFCY